MATAEKHSASHDNRQHNYMLEAGEAYFKGRYPAEWERVRSLSLEQGLTEMRKVLLAEESEGG